jgi:hypothetical protein
MGVRERRPMTINPTIRCGGHGNTCARPPLHPGRCDPAADHRYPYRPYRQTHEGPRGPEVTCDGCGQWTLDEHPNTHTLDVSGFDTVLCDGCYMVGFWRVDGWEDGWEPNKETA